MQAVSAVPDRTNLERRRTGGNRFWNFLGNLQPEAVFVALAACIGLVMVFYNPLFKTPDEPNQLDRAYQISTLRFLPTLTSAGMGGYIPKSIVNLERTFGTPHADADVTLIPHDVVAAEFPNTALYSPIVYVPQALGLDLARLFGLSPLAMAYAGRLANLFFWILAVYASIRITKAGKWLFCALAITPMAMQQAGSLSADVVTNSLSFLMIAMAIRLFDRDYQPSNTFLLSAAAISIALGLSKEPFFILSALLLIVPIRRNLSRKKQLLVSGAIVIAGIVATLGWAMVTKHYFVPPRQDVYISLNDQLTFVSTHPLAYGRILLRTFYLYGDIFVQGFIGNLDQLDVPLNLWAVVLGYLMLIWAAVTNGNEWPVLPTFWQKAGVLIISLVMIVGISTLLYVSWNSPGHGIIDGIQGRYFIALSPLLALLLANREISLRSGTASTAAVVILGSLLLFLDALLKLHAHYS